ncbi:MAG: DUF3553 domain-containing protein [Myxococcota bacterium]|nr:DUF3553 domain-containing protein [Myxococcota bacterium]
MRFVRNSTASDWGVGVVAGDDAVKLTILFDGAGYKKVERGFRGLVELPDADVPANHALRKPQDWPKVERDGMRAGASRHLPKRFDGFIAEFLSLFPGGLRSPECDKAERDDKVEAVEFAKGELAPAVLVGLLARGEHKEILQRVRRSLSKVNLAFPNELMKLSDLPAPAEKAVAERIVALVSAGDETPAALEDLANALKPHGAAKWPVVSLLPFLIDPERWPFVKPTFIKRAEKATGIDVEYDPQPNARTYALVRDLYGHVARALRERGLAPRDFIDVQTFLWVASGMAREAAPSVKGRPSEERVRKVKA